MDRLTVDPRAAALILIDVQPPFIDGMAGEAEPVLARLEHLLLLVEEHGIPCLATFEHPVERNGWLPRRLERVFPAGGRRLVKRTFNLCGEADIRRAIAELDRPQVLVAGTETDVCVLQSTLGLLGLGLQVFLLEDCLFSSEPNAGPALRRMAAAGAVPLTYKSLHYELKQTVDVESHHHAWNRRIAGGGFVNPEALPPSRPIE